MMSLPAPALMEPPPEPPLMVSFPAPVDTEIEPVVVVEISMLSAPEPVSMETLSIFWKVVPSLEPPVTTPLVFEVNLIVVLAVSVRL
jgi:hypothetical protein